MFAFKHDLELTSQAFQKCQLWWWCLFITERSFWVWIV